MKGLSLFGDGQTVGFAYFVRHIPQVVKLVLVLSELVTVLGIYAIDDKVRVYMLPVFMRGY